MENPMKKNANEAIGTIIITTTALCSFIFTRIFALDFHFFANSLWYLTYAFLPTTLITLFFGKRIYHYYLQKSHLQKSTVAVCTFFAITTLWMFFAAGLSLINSFMSNQEIKLISVGVESIELKTHKHSRNYVAVFEMPFNVSCCFIPETKTELAITDKEAESFRLGQSKLEIQYKEGYFRIPYLINKKFIP